MQVIALADAAEENQANMFRALTKLKSATHLVITLISLWQKLSADQVAILEATFLPLAEDTQELVRIFKSCLKNAHWQNCKCFNLPISPCTLLKTVLWSDLVALWGWCLMQTTLTSQESGEEVDYRMFYSKTWVIPVNFCLIHP